MAFRPTRWSKTALLRPWLPSFISDLVWPDQRPTWKIHPTSYLDGLRGIASVIVFFCHYTEENHRYLTPSYGLNPDNTPSSWIQLPFFRIIFSGRPMVHIFFIISGFVLSYKPLKTIHAREFEKCFATLASSAFRRPIRLFAPCIVSTFIVVLLIQGGYMWWPLATFSEQFWMWKNAVFHNITWPWAWDADLRPGYDIHLWTIPIEFAHSMLLFLVIIMTSKLRRVVRQVFVFGLLIYFLCCGKWAAFEFMGGMFLAEFFLLRQSRRVKAWEPSYDEPPSKLRRVVRTLFHVSVIVVGLFIGGWPNEDADKTPGIRYLNAQTPEPFASIDILAPQKFWFAIAAAFMVWSAGELGAVRRFLEGPFAQYCGRVSYAVYICHGPVLETMQTRVLGRAFEPARGTPGEEGFAPAVEGTRVRGIFGVETPGQRTMSWFVGILIIGSMVVWAADVFWRLVDNPIISAAKKLENACLDKDTEADRRSQEKYGLLA